MVMPEGMARRKSNTTRWNHQTKCLEWRVHLVFLLRPVESLTSLLASDYLSSVSNPAVFSGSLSIFCDGIAEDCSLQQVVEKALDLDPVS